MSKNDTKQEIDELLCLPQGSDVYKALVAKTEEQHGCITTFSFYCPGCDIYSATKDICRFCKKELESSDKYENNYFDQELIKNINAYLKQIDQIKEYLQNYIT